MFSGPRAQWMKAMSARGDATLASQWSIDIIGVMSYSTEGGNGRMAEKDFTPRF